MEGDQPSPFCYVNTSQISLFHILIIIFVVLAVFLAIAALYRLYMSLRMKKEIKGEVNKTLEQYYRYIETFEENSDQPGTKRSKSQLKSRPLNESLEEVP